MPYSFILGRWYCLPQKRALPEAGACYPRCGVQMDGELPRPSRCQSSSGIRLETARCDIGVAGARAAGPPGGSLASDCANRVGFQGGELSTINPSSQLPVNFCSVSFDHLKASRYALLSEIY